MNRYSLRAWLPLLAIVALLCAAHVPAAHAQDTGHDMPGMQMPEKKPAPKKKAQPAEEKKAQTEKQSEAAPAPAPSPTTVMPTTDALPQTAAPAPVAQPQASPTPDHSRMQMGGVEDQAQPSNKSDSMEGMEMGTPGASSGKVEVIGSGGEMAIPVGARQGNSIAMGQMGSGTSWQPATTPMYMLFKPAGKWLLFLHGDLKLGVNAQGGPRGVTKFESQNWLMPMAFRRLGAGTLQLRGMFSFEPFTFPRGGSPLLFQTGESFRGRPLVDAQHPHDLFMELSASYILPLGERATWFTYLGFPGEPALGPNAFMHRMSASENPSAPLAHHLQDSSHISFGVFTTGFTYRWLRLEGSVFNGREPDEHRYNFEFNPWTSRSVRISVAPNENWSAQWSYGLLKNPEALQPGDVRRMTASVSHNRRFTRGNWATSLIWGRNREFHDGAQTLNGYTLESTVNFLDRNYLYTRLELADKNGLLSHDEARSLGFTSDHPSFRIGAYTLGYARDVWNTDRFSVALGSDLTFYSKPDALDIVYGTNPASYRFFLRVRPSRMTHGGGHTH